MKSDLSFLSSRPVSWLSPAGPDEDIVISTRIRLARDLKDMPFPSAENHEILRSVRNLCMEAIGKTEAIADPLDIDCSSLDPLERQLLLERRLISGDFPSPGGGSELVAEKDESVSIMINEEDHLRLQAFSPGFQLPAVWERISALDDRLSSRLEFAFDPQFGYLTASPSNLGTGMRASVMMHLPGLALSHKLDGVMQGITKIGMAVQGFYGEHSPYTGNLYLISNQSSLGESEEQIIFRLSALVSQIVRHEKEARNHLLAQKRDFTLNHAGRAYGILRYGYQISSQEALDSLSALRLGVDLGMFSSISIDAVNFLFLLVQPAHLSYHAGRELEKEERDSERAKVIRETLKGLREKL